MKQEKVNDLFNIKVPLNNIAIFMCDKKEDGVYYEQAIAVLLKTKISDLVWRDKVYEGKVISGKYIGCDAYIEYTSDRSLYLNIVDKQRNEYCLLYNNQRIRLDYVDNIQTGFGGERPEFVTIGRVLRDMQGYNNRLKNQAKDKKRKEEEQERAMDELFEQIDALVGTEME